MPLTCDASSFTKLITSDPVRSEFDFTILTLRVASTVLSTTNYSAAELQMDIENQGKAPEKRSNSQGSPFELVKCHTPMFSLTTSLQLAVACEGNDSEDSELEVEDDTDDDEGGGNGDLGGVKDGEDHGGRQFELVDSEQLQKRKAYESNFADLPAIKRPIHQLAPLAGPPEVEPIRRSRKRGEGRQSHNKKHKNAQRKAKNLKSFKDNTTKLRTSKALESLGSATTVPAKLFLETLPSNSSGYEATYERSQDRRTLNMQELLAEGYEVIEWDGLRPLILVEEDTKKIFFIGVPKPDDPTYDSACDEVAELLVNLGTNGSFAEDEFSHKRGEKFAAINLGTSAGHGPQEPYTLRNDKHKDVDDILRRSPALERLALHQSASLKLYVPKLYDYYHSHTMPIRERLPRLNPPWDRSIFSTMACNCGVQVSTYFHRDCRDLVFGKCAIHAVGRYDHRKGGHMVLKEPKLIIQFPAGTHVLLPSAIITHGNTPVRDGEIRASFTQYTAGAMFRYVDNGFTTEKKLKKKNKAEYLRIQQAKASRWEMGLGMWSTVEELLKSWEASATK